MKSTSGDSNLKIFSAGAVAPPLIEIVRIFEKEQGVKCEVVAGKPSAISHISPPRRKVM